MLSVSPGGFFIGGIHPSNDMPGIIYICPGIAQRQPHSPAKCQKK